MAALEWAAIAGTCQGKVMINAKIKKINKYVKKQTRFILLLHITYMNY